MSFKKTFPSRENAHLVYLSFICVLEWKQKEISLVGVRFWVREWNVMVWVRCLLQSLVFLEEVNQLAFRFPSPLPFSVSAALLHLCLPPSQSFSVSTSAYCWRCEVPDFSSSYHTCLHVYCFPIMIDFYPSGTMSSSFYKVSLS